MTFLEKAKYAIERAHKGTIQLVRSLRVPIIKYVDSLTKLECDINVNMILGIANSSLIAAYSEYDERFHILGYLLKEWGKLNQVHGGDKQLLTSYAFFNMLIQYLQIVQPPVLPNLQKLFLSSPENTTVLIKYPVPAAIADEAEFKPEEDLNHHGYRESLKNIKMRLIPTNIYFEQDLLKVRDKMERDYGLNNMSVPELFAGFFRYYSFDFNVNE